MSASDETPRPTGNGKEPPVTIERLDWRVTTLEGESEGRRLTDALISRVAEEVARIGKQTRRIAEALRLDPDADGPSPDITGQIAALRETDAQLAARIAHAAKWPTRITAALSKIAKATPRIVIALGVVSAAVWGLKQSIDEGIVFLRAWGGP